MVDGYEERMAEGLGDVGQEQAAADVNVQLAAEGLLDPEQLSTAEKVRLADIRAGKQIERERRLAEREAAESPEARRAAAGYEVVDGQLVKTEPAAAEEPGFVEQLRESVLGVLPEERAEVGAEAAPAEAPPSTFEQVMGQAAGLTRRLPARRIETRAKPILEREREETLEAMGREELAEVKGAAIEAEGMQRVADIEQETHDRLRDMQIDEAKNEFERQQYVEQEKRKLDSAIDKYRTGQIRDPWADRSTVERVRDGLAIAMGALGQAFLGGENVALSMINTALDSEMESQRANVGIAGAAVGMQENALQESMRVTGDARIAELHARESMLEAIKYKLRSEAQATGSQMVVANAEKTIAQMDQQIAGLKSQQDLRIQQMGYATVGGGFAVPKEQRELGLKLLEKGVTEQIEVAGKIQLEQAKRMSSGERGGLSPESFATKLESFGNRIADADDSKRTLRRFLDRYGEGDIPGFKAAWFDPRTKFSELSEAARHVNQEVGSMIASYVKSISGGTVPVEEYERLKKVVIGAGTISDLRNGLKIMEAKIDDRITNIEKSTKPEVVEAYRTSPVRSERPGELALETKYGGRR